MRQSNMELLIKANTKNAQINSSGQKGNIVFRRILMFSTNILIYIFNNNQFPSFTFYDPHKKTHGVRGLIKH